jgi:putative transposase
VTDLLETRPRKAYALAYDLVIVPLRRAPVLTDPLVESVRDVLEGIVDDHGCAVQRVVWEPDHLRLHFTAEPGTDLPTFVNAIKTATSRRVRNEFADVRERFESGFWEPGYVLGTARGADPDDLVGYAEERYAWPGRH